MSTPYEQMLKASSRSSSSASLHHHGTRRPPSASTSASKSASASSTPQSMSSTASISSKKSNVKKPKPNLPFFCKPRYRFDLPDPPMDPKMLLGHISTTSYAEPFVSDLEKDFRPVSIPSDPCYGLRVNLNIPATPSSNSKNNYGVKKPFKLTIDDDALLQSVLNSRISATATASASTSNNKLSNDRSNNNSANNNNVNTNNNNSASTNNNQMQASNVSNAPWMRRMSYDEYAVSNSVSSSKRAIVNTAVAAKSPMSNSRQRDDNHIAKEKRKSQLLASFTLVKQKPTHPDIRKQGLKPVSVMPVFLDFKSLGSSFVLLDFDKDEHLTVEERVKDIDNPKNTKEETKRKQELAYESVRSLASVSIADNNAPKDDEPTKKYIACYTPTNSTLDKRARKRKDAMSDEENDDDDQVDQAGRKKKKAKKIHFVDDESYEWIGEYAIRETRYGESYSMGGDGNRSCFAISNYESDDRRKRVACFSRISTSWKLSRKPVDEHVGQLGKEGLELHRHLDNKDQSEVSQERMYKILCGPDEHYVKREKKQELLEILEQD